MPVTGGGAALAGLGVLGLAGALAGRRRVLLLTGVALVAISAAGPAVGPTVADSQSIVEDRGTYEVEAESIISPGQSGFIDPTGQESPHYDDQHQLYAEWAYKPMPLHEEDVKELGDGEVTTLTYTP